VNQTNIDSARSDFTNDALNLLDGLMYSRRGGLRQQVSAQLKRVHGSKSYGGHEQLQVGDLIQVLVHESRLNQRFVELSHDGQGAPTFFLIGAILSAPSGKIWTLVKQCPSAVMAEQIPNYNKALVLPSTWEQFYKQDARRMCSFISLDYRVRKVGYIHDCSVDGQCTFGTSSNTISHSTTTLRGGSFFILPRNSAYPPRRS